MVRIAVLVSGGGTNLQALLDAQEAGKIPNGQIVKVIASRPDAYALERAARHGVETAVVSRKAFASAEEFDGALLRELESCGAGLVVLAGFLSILGGEGGRGLPRPDPECPPRPHPSFCGKGFYGLKVHEAALAYGVKVTGATVHFVNEIPDGGAILLQKAVGGAAGDTPETLQRRVMEEAEWELLPRAVSLFCDGKIRVEGRTAVIME